MEEKIAMWTFAEAMKFLAETGIPVRRKGWNGGPTTSISSLDMNATDWGAAVTLLSEDVCPSSKA